MTLTDGDLIAPAPSSTVRRWWRDAYDRLAGSDPGLTQLRTAVQAVLGMAVAVAAGYGIVRSTGALEIDAAGVPAALVAAQHHGVLVIAMLLAAMTAMLAGFVVNDATARGQVVTSVLIPVPMLAAMTVGLVLGRWHAVSLAWLVVALMLGVYLRRFGPRGFAAGMVLFNGSFLGYFLQAEIPVRDVGWIAVLLYTGVAASLLVRFGLLRPDAAGTLRRMRRSWVARARRLTGLALELTDASCTDRRRRTLAGRIQRQLTRLNESTLMIDGQLANPSASTTALVLHQRLFDMELALSNTARFAVALTDRDLDVPVAVDLRACLAALHADDYGPAGVAVERLRAHRPADATVAILLDRFTQSVTTLVVARREWLMVADTAGDPTSPGAAFTPAVELAAGWLPGSMPVADEASKSRGRSRFFDSAVMPMYVRSAIQIGVAATLAILIGGLVSERRLYWALLATFLAFLATTNSGEQVRKALFRVGGTAVGIVVGAVAVHLTDGNLTASFSIIGVALFFGIYLIRINYMFMVVGITVSMSQLYVQLDEFSWSLLLLRLAETGIGVGAVVLTVLVVVPLRPQRVLTAGVLLYVRALRAVVERSLTTVASGTGVTRADVRNLDAAHHALVTTATPLRRATYGRNSSQLAEVLAVAAAARYYARNLAVGVEPWATGAALTAWAPAADRLRTSFAAIEDRVRTGTTGTYVRSAALFDPVDRALLPGSGRAGLVVRDLMLLDGALARLAAALAMPVTDLDTAAVPASSRSVRAPETSGSAPAPQQEAVAAGSGAVRVPVGLDAVRAHHA